MTTIPPPTAAQLALVVTRPTRSAARQCSHCDRPIRRVRWCLVYGPNPAQKRVPVCSKCKKMLGVYA